MDEGRRVVARRQTSLALALVCWMVGASWATAASADGWIATIDAYLAGDYAGAASQLETLLQHDTRSDVAAALARLREDAAAASRGSAERRLAVRRLQGAVLVPLEALLPLSARVADDPRFAPLEDALRQALAVLARGERTAGLETAAFRAWAQVGLMQFLLDSGRLDDLEGVAQEMRLPKHRPDLKVEHDLLRGMVRERTARVVTGAGSGGNTYLGMDAAGAQGYVPPGSAAGGVSVRADRAVMGRRYMTTAARWYEQVLAVRPDHPEARLRLARTWLERDEAGRALAQLAPLITRPCASVVCALAVLFTGEAHERSGDVRQAADFYRAASADASTRHSALLALLGLAVERGGDDALALARLFTSTVPPATERPDAWGTYVGGRRADADAVLVPLRRELLP